MKNGYITIGSAVLCLTVLTQPLMAAASCKSVEGEVRLTPDATCNVATAFPDVHFIGAPGSCFSVTTKGDLKGQGYAGLSQEIIAGADGATTTTPSVLLETGVAGLPTGGSRQLLTARTFLSIDKIFTEKKSTDQNSTEKSNLYTTDVVLISPQGVMEQLLITGGTNKLTGATGHVVVTGNSIEEWAEYEGVLCRP